MHQTPVNSTHRLSSKRRIEEGAEDIQVEKIPRAGTARMRNGRMAKGGTGKDRDDATAITSMWTPRVMKVGGEERNLWQPKETPRGNDFTPSLVGREDR